MHRVMFENWLVIIDKLVKECDEDIDGNEMFYNPLFMIMEEYASLVLINYLINYAKWTYYFLKNSCKC